MWRTVPTSSKRNRWKQKNKKSLDSSSFPCKNKEASAPSAQATKELYSPTSRNEHHKVKLIHRKLTAAAKMLACRRSGNEGSECPVPHEWKAKGNNQGATSIRYVETVCDEVLPAAVEAPPQQKSQGRKEYAWSERWAVAELFIPSLRQEIDTFLEEVVSRLQSSPCQNGFALERMEKRNTFDNEGSSGCPYDEDAVSHSRSVSIHLKGLGIGRFDPDDSVCSFLQMGAFIALQTECKRAIKAFYKRWNRKREEGNPSHRQEEVGGVEQCCPHIAFTATFFDPACRTSFYHECCQSFGIVPETENKNGAYAVDELSRAGHSSLNPLLSSSSSSKNGVLSMVQTPRNFTDEGKRTLERSLSLEKNRCLLSSVLPSDGSSRIPAGSCDTSFSSSFLIVYAPHIPWVVLHNLFAANWCNPVPTPPSRVPQTMQEPFTSRTSCDMHEGIDGNHHFSPLLEKINSNEKKEVREDLACLRTVPISSGHPLLHLVVISNDPRNVPLLSQPPKWCVFHPSFPSLFCILPSIPSCVTRSGKRRGKQRNSYLNTSFVGSGELPQRRNRRISATSQGVEDEEEVVMLGKSTIGEGSCFSREDFEKAFHGTAIYSVRKDLTGLELSKTLNRISANPPAIVKLCGELR